VQCRKGKKERRQQQLAVLYDVDDDDDDDDDGWLLIYTSIGLLMTNALQFLLHVAITQSERYEAQMSDFPPLIRRDSLKHQERRGR
jgi:hypothetical protein